MKKKNTSKHTALLSALCTNYTLSHAEFALKTTVQLGVLTDLGELRGEPVAELLQGLGEALLADRARPEHWSQSSVMVIRPSQSSVLHNHDHPDSPLPVMTLEHGLLLLHEGEQAPELSHVDGAWE